MNRFTAAIKVDLLNQWRNHLYSIGLGVGLLIAVMLAWLAPLQLMARIVPSLILTVIGGSTLMYVGGMITFERDERTLTANIVSPLRSSEYLWAKIITLGTLSGIESLVMVAGSLLFKMPFENASMPSLFPLVCGILLMGMMYTLAGIILVVRFRSITDFLIPMAVVAVIAQLPILYFLEMVPLPAFLVIPTSAPSMLIRGAFQQLNGWEWFYGFGYSAFTLGLLIAFANSAFRHHVVEKGG